MNTGDGGGEGVSYSQWFLVVSICMPGKSAKNLYQGILVYRLNLIPSKIPMGIFVCGEGIWWIWPQI